MKKLITLFGVMMMLAGTAFAQNCNFKVKFKVTPASCPNNGKVHYALVDANDNPVTIPATMGLDSVRIYYKVSEGDSAHYSYFYTGGWDSMMIDHGNYIIGVEGICNCGPGCYNKVDTHLVMNIPTTYTIPVVESFSNVATTESDYNTSLGMRPTINCLPTGRVQLKIMDGRFPFTVDIINQATGDTLRTETRQTRQYSGTNPSTYNYRDYYSFDSLPAGNWEFHIEDGCGYKMPIHTQQVTVVQFPRFKSMTDPNLSRLTSSTYADEEGNHVLRVYVNIDNPSSDMSNNRYRYILQYFPQLVEYRFKYGNGEYSEWKSSPTPNYYYYYIYDTIRGEKLCDLFNQTVTFQYRDKCNNTTNTKTFQLYNPTTTSYYSESSTSTPYVYHGCGYTSNSYHYQTSYYYISLYSYYSNNSVSSSIGSYPFKKSLKWIYIDVSTGDTIKVDPITSLTNTSYLYANEFAAKFGSFEDAPVSRQIRRVLVSEECGVLATNTVTMTFRHYNSSGTTYTPYWTTTYSNSGYCCTSERYAGVYSNYYYPNYLDYDSIIVRLVRSPLNNRYNFEAVFHNDTKTWTYKKVHLENTARLGGASDGTNFYIYDYCLPSGPYEWEIITPCGTYYPKQNVSFYNTYETYFVQQPSYVIEEECTRATLTYTSGKIGFHQTNTNSTTGNPLTLSDYIPPTTCFRIISGPAGGYDISSNRYYKVGEPIHISMKGRYIVQYFYSTSTTSPITSASTSYFCSNIYDTIDYEPARTVEFDYAEALLCEPSSPRGTVYVQGKKGSKPYTYTLYRGADKQGDVIGTNTTGVFENVNMTPHDEFSCSVQDSCGASFFVNIRPKTWSELQKVWFDGGLTVTTTCEGSTICVNALSIGNILSYEWTGPDGFSDNVSRSCVFIPRGGEEGWYKVHIYHSGCADDYEDSIYLHIDRAPTVELSSDLTVCPGAPAELKFVPNSGNGNTTENITVRMVFESETGKSYQYFYAQPGDTIKHTITPLTHTKIYTQLISDGTCSYPIADDTQHVYIHTIDPYTITSENDSVCVEITANPSAFSSLTPPYVIRWYNDYNLTDLVKEDTIDFDDDPSNIVVPNLTQDRIFYLMVENDETCPTTYGKPIHILNMGANGESDTTELSLGNTYRFYDSGGPSTSYGANERFVHVFRSTDGKPVTIKFESFYFYSNAHLYVFSGDTTNVDSLLCDLTNGSENPGTITSKGNALTCYFVSGSSRTTGWNAIVEHEPAKVIAAVRPTNVASLSDTICQSRTRTYDDSRYHISPDITTIESLNNVVKVPGSHTFSNLLPGADRHGCDSIVNFKLVVEPAPRRDTTVVITTTFHEGYEWCDSVYTKSGNYARFYTLSDGCDSLDVLHLVVLVIDTADIDFCKGDTTELTVSAVEMPSVRTDSIIPTVIYLGDVLCTDGSVMPVKEFLSSGKTAMGVVLSVDENSGYGRAIALTNAYSNSTMRWAYNNSSYYTSIHSTTKTTSIEAVMDMDGAKNTNEILRTAKMASGTTNTATYAPAAHYCKFYNHNTYTTGTDSLGWYLPAAGEMQLIYGNRVELNNTLYELNKRDNRNTLLTNNSYWTSTEYNDNYAWYLYNIGYLTYTSKYASYYARPVIQFPLP